MGQLNDIITEGTGKSSKRVISLLAVAILIQMTEVWLLGDKAFDTYQLIFIFGFWVFVAGYAQYLTIAGKKLPSILSGAKDKAQQIVNTVEAADSAINE